jgi:aspartate racemase
MKKIGLVGGLGPEATIDYYKGIINTFSEKSTELNYPEIVIYSVNMSEFISMMNQKAYEEATNYLLGKVQALAAAGCGFAALTANTPHLLYPQLVERSPIPLISIVEATCEEALKQGLRRPGLIGTSFTMKSNFYADVFSRKDIAVVLPNDDEMETINHKLFTEIELGIFKEETRLGLIDIISNMKSRENIDSIILGCTEFPLILTEDTYAGIPVLNTTKIHVETIVKYCLNG